MHRHESKTAIACIPYLGEGSGFALPLFADISQPDTLYVQEVDEYTGLVSAFRLVASVQSSMSLRERALSSLGLNPVYAFIDETGTAVAGKLIELESSLRSFLIRRPMDSAVCLQIAELIGLPEERRDARLRMRQTIASVSGTSSATAFYERALLRSAMWNALVKAASSEDIARKVLLMRPRLDVAITPNGDLSINLDALNEDDRKNIDVESVKAQLKGEFYLTDIEKVSAELMGPSEPQPAPNSDARLVVALQELAQARRQERRLAIIFDALLSDRSFGMALLQRYARDPAIFTNTTIQHMRAMLPLVSDRERFQEIMYQEIYRTLVDFYGLRKGELLLEFAERLGKYEEVHRMISSKLRRSESQYVLIFQADIERALAKAAKKHQRGPDELPLFKAS